MQNKISHSEMVTKLAKPGADIISDLTPNSAHILHMAVGISGECGELLSAIYFQDSYKDVDLGNILEELGDIEFYLEGYRQEMGYNRESTLSDFAKVDDPDYTITKDSAIKLLIHTSDLLDYSKKFSMYAKPIKSASVLDSLVDIEKELNIIRQCFDYDHEVILDHNIDKLMTGKNARYKEGSYSNDQAKDRADKK